MVIWELEVYGRFRWRVGNESRREFLDFVVVLDLVNVNFCFKKGGGVFVILNRGGLRK